MSFQYTDERIPDRHSRSGRKRRPGQVPRTASDTGRLGLRENTVSGISRSGLREHTASDIGRWNMITEEELFGVPSSRRNVQSGEAAGPFAELLRMTARYQVSDEGRREAFLEQARKMCDYEEEGYVPDVSYYHAFVGYQEMDAHELHSYFIWRTKQKRSEKVPFNSGFAMLRSAELINLIGVKDMEEAFSQLLSLEYEARSASGKTGTGLTADHNLAVKRMRSILSDFVITWGPSEEIVQAYCVSDMNREADNVTLFHYESSDDGSICRMIRNLIPRRAMNSAFMEEAGENAWRVIARVFRRVCMDQEKHGDESLAGRLLGKRRERTRDLFQWIPYKTRVEEGYHIEISPVSSYTYQGGVWHEFSYPVMRDEEALRKLETLVRECERVLRRKMHYRNQLPNRMNDPKLESLIASEYDRFVIENERRSRPEIHVDLSKLERIRSLAAITRERLLEGTDEGEEADALNEAMPASAETSEYQPASGQSEQSEHQPASGQSEQLEHQPASGQSEQSEHQPVSGFFTDRESTFLRMLLDGGNGADFFRDHSVMPSVFVDRINDKAYDEIGDSIVEETGSGWSLVEDYTEDVMNLLDNH